MIPRGIEHVCLDDIFVSSVFLYVMWAYSRCTEPKILFQFPLTKLKWGFAALRMFSRMMCSRHNTLPLQWNRLYKMITCGLVFFFFTRELWCTVDECVKFAQRNSMALHIRLQEKKIKQCFFFFFFWQKECNHRLLRYVQLLFCCSNSKKKEQ